MNVARPQSRPRQQRRSRMKARAPQTVLSFGSGRAGYRIVESTAPAQQGGPAMAPKTAVALVRKNERPGEVQANGSPPCSGKEEIAWQKPIHIAVHTACGASPKARHVHQLDRDDPKRDSAEKVLRRPVSPRVARGTVMAPCCNPTHPIVRATRQASNPGRPMKDTTSTLSADNGTDEVPAPRKVQGLRPAWCRARDFAPGVMAATGLPSGAAVMAAAW